VVKLKTAIVHCKNMAIFWNINTLNTVSIISCESISNKRSFNLLIIRISTIVSSWFFHSPLKRISSTSESSVRANAESSTAESGLESFSETVCEKDSRPVSAVELSAMAFDKGFLKKISRLPLFRQKLVLILRICVFLKLVLCFVVDWIINEQLFDMSTILYVDWIINEQLFDMSTILYVSRPINQHSSAVFSG
jgi:hypothetical protein